MEIVAQLAYLATCGGLAFLAMAYAPEYEITEVPEGITGVVFGFIFLCLLVGVGGMGYLIPHLIAELVHGKSSAYGPVFVEPNPIGRLAQFIAPVMLLYAFVAGFVVVQVLMRLGLLIWVGSLLVGWAAG